jgi:hypothetical protein
MTGVARTAAKSKDSSHLRAVPGGARPDGVRGKHTDRVNNKAKPGDRIPLV